jgi:hypothetical protein
MRQTLHIGSEAGTSLSQQGSRPTRSVGMRHMPFSNARVASKSQARVVVARVAELSANELRGEAGVPDSSHGYAVCNLTAPGDRGVGVRGGRSRRTPTT